MVALKAQVANISDSNYGIGLEEVIEGFRQREANVKDKNSKEGETTPGLM